MFSQLGPLFKTVLRQAEKSDARLEIRRDEKQDQGKKQEFETQEEEGSFLWDDSTTVSVGALRTFLIEFLKTKGESADETIAQSETTPVLPQAEKIAPVSNIAAKAVKAYTSMAAQTAAPVLAPVESKPEQAQGGLVDLLAADEVRTIHVLIQELDLLARRGVETLTIEKADTFLESLIQAVRLEKAKA